MISNNQIILSGRYQIIQNLGFGQTSTVYLARHLSLNTDRAIKVIPKAGASPVSVLTEAQLLRSLNHPGIPTIYDLEEDDTNYYLVEEYIQGESLEACLLHHKLISTDFFLSFCEQLCDIFRYLHSLHPAPVFYQDLKPEHIIVCGTQLKLIDFGVAWNTGSSGNNFKCFGNLEFSAPEVQHGKSCSYASDIYSIGKMIQYFLDHKPLSGSQNITHIIQKATSPEPELRYETVDELLLAIQTNLQRNCHAHLFQKIAIAGSHNGCGSTHLAISLVSTLNGLGHCTFYHEANSSNHVRQLLHYQTNWTEKDGYYMYDEWKGYPFYGPGILISDQPQALHIYDFGSEFTKESFQDFDLILLICGSSLWNYENAIHTEELLHSYRNKLRFICNPGTKRAASFYARYFHAPVYTYFYDPDPFQVSKEKKDFAFRLLPEKGRTHPFLNFIHNLLHQKQ